MSLRQKLLLASNNHGSDIQFDDVLAHIICFVTAAHAQFRSRFVLKLLSTIRLVT